jgi:hypothetical protein
MAVCCTAVTAGDQQPCQLNACLPDDTAGAYCTICKCTETASTPEQNRSQDRSKYSRTQSYIGQLAGSICALPSSHAVWQTIVNPTKHPVHTHGHHTCYTDVTFSLLPTCVCADAQARQPHLACHCLPCQLSSQPQLSLHLNLARLQGLQQQHNRRMCIAFRWLVLQASCVPVTRIQCGQ